MMMTQVIISDYVVERRMIYLLETADFDAQVVRWEQTDPLLATFSDHPFFIGCKQWSDLKIMHFHALIINMVKIVASHSDAEIADKMHPSIYRLTFFLCSLISLIQQQTGSTIDLFRVNRVGRDDVVYDYSARLDVIVAVPKSGLRLVIDNA